MLRKLFSTLILSTALLVSLQSHAEGPPSIGFGKADAVGYVAGSFSGALGPILGPTVTALFDASTSNSGQVDLGQLGLNTAVAATTYSIDTIGLGIAGVELSGAALLCAPVTLAVAFGGAFYELSKIAPPTQSELAAYLADTSIMELTSGD